MDLSYEYAKKGDFILLSDDLLLYVSSYGYLALFVLLALGFVGIPLPEQTLLTFTGFLVSEGGLNYFIAVLATTLGTFAGVSLSFFVGHYLGIPFLEKYGYLVKLSKPRLKKLEGWFAKYGKFTVSIGFFIPGLRHFTAYFAGIGKWKFSTFTLYALPGAFVWITTFITFGYFVGENWQEYLKRLDEQFWILLVSGLLVFLTVWLYRKYANVTKIK